MTLSLQVPGRPSRELEYLLLDANGTLSRRGVLLDGVAERLAALRPLLQLRLLSADTFGTLAGLAEQLELPARAVRSGGEKLTVLRELGPARCAAIGNGSNDALMLADAALGIAVVGAEGCSAAALSACDLVCASVVDALDLLQDPRALAATLRD
jgi:P-type E1-E2 ATPase